MLYLGEIVMAYKELDSTDVVCQLCGERQWVAHQTRHTLPQGVIEALDMIGFAGVLRDSAVLPRRVVYLIAADNACGLKTG